MGILDWLEEKFLLPEIPEKASKVMAKNQRTFHKWYQNWQLYDHKKNRSGYWRGKTKVPEMILTWQETPEQLLRTGNQEKTVTFIFYKCSLSQDAIAQALGRIRIPEQCLISGDSKGLQKKSLSQQQVLGFPYRGRKTSYPLSGPVFLSVYLSEAAAENPQGLSLSLQHEKKGNFLIVRLHGIRSVLALAGLIEENYSVIVPNFTIRHYLQFSVTEIDARKEDFAFLN